ncbi:MAG TPA: signal peptide peptidase SppA [Phycisphaerae bacterium]|nr:signal peptide peptidase SppA [Phycisphaerae bacterium]HRY69733.1 signal peptide peptidase SppA [Phycisphaerae bacterium]
MRSIRWPMALMLVVFFAPPLAADDAAALADKPAQTAEADETEKADGKNKAGGQADKTDEAEAKVKPEKTSQSLRGGSKAAVEADKIVVLQLGGELMEKPPEVSLGLDMEVRRSLHDLLQRLRRAEKDKSVKALVFTFEDPSIGWAQMQELRVALDRLRKARKDVYFYIENAGGGLYQLATAASRICISPAGEVGLIGLRSEGVYLKGLLDKIGVEADIEHIGAYKSAGESLTRTGPSDEAKEMMNWVLKDLFDQMVDTIAEGRQIPADKIRELIDRGPFNAQQALDAQLVDEILDADAFAESLRERHGRACRLVHNYGEKKGPEIDLSSPFAFFKLLGESMGKQKKTGKNSVAVVYIDGTLMTGKTAPGLLGESEGTGSTTIRWALAQARHDDAIKAVVLRINSPGGSALASDIMWRAARTLAEVKPVVVSMGNVAASGGYYLSVGAPTIFAEPGTLTGSIGVVGGKVVTKGLWDWLGVSFHEYKFGQNSDLYSTSQRFDDRQRALIREQMNHVYQMFADCVKKGRDGKLKKNLDDLAGGRVFTGRQALDQGLVDKLGGLEDAIVFAAERANITDYQVQTLPETRNFMDMLLKSLTGQPTEEEGGGKGVSTGIRGWLVKQAALQDILKALRLADPARARAVLGALRRAELLRSEATLLVMPCELLVR